MEQGPELEVFLSQGSVLVDISCASEHFLTQDEIREFSAENYQVVCHFARESHSGGVFVAARSSIPCFEIPGVAGLSVPFVCEAAAASLPGMQLQIVTMYRTPRVDLNVFLEILADILTRIDVGGRVTLVSGDFNVRFIPMTLIVCNSGT